MSLLISPQIVPIVAFVFLTFSIFYCKAKGKSILILIRINAFFTAMLIGVTFIGFVLFQVYRQLTYADYFFLITGILIIISVLIIMIFRNKIKISNNIKLLTTVLIYTYLFCEIIINILVQKGYFKSLVSISDGTFGAFNKTCVQPDLIKGYRWENDSIRIIKAVNSTIVYDRKFKPNNNGYVSEKNYSSKKSSNTYRFIVFGDSYSAAEYLKMPWPDKIERFINSGSDTCRYEFYSFALDGIGISNWHSIFFNEIAGIFDFDAIILAIYGDDLYRDFFMMYSDNLNIYGSYLNSKPKNLTEFDKFYKKDMFAAGKIMNDSTIDNNLKLNNFSTESNIIKDNLYLLIKAHALLQSFEYEINKKSYEKSFYNNYNNTKDKLSIELIKSKLGKNKFHMLDEIIMYCKKNNKDVFFASIPHIEIVKLNNYRNCKSSYQLELEAISNYYNAYFYDAYPDFQKLTFDTLQSYYLKNDAHWNQNGSDFFTRNFTQFIKKKIFAKRKCS